jgi:ribosomal protein S18 acetylase RimI-like enzyme
MPDKTARQSKVQDIQAAFIGKRLAFGKRQTKANEWEYYAYFKPAYSPASAIAKLNIIIEGSIAPDATLLCNFGVRPKYRKFGIARKLMSYALADPTLPREITLFARPSTDGKNTDTIKQLNLEKFYHGFGFRHTGRSSSMGLGTQMVLKREPAND